LVGSTTAMLNAPSAYWALFVDENGDSLRSFTEGYDRNAHCKCTSINEIENENYIISGGIEDSGINHGNGMIWTLGLDSDARKLWERIDGSDNQYSNQKGYASCILSDTSVAITGFYYLPHEFGSPEGKLWILEITASGEGRYILDEGWDLLTFGQSITLTYTNELCVAGYAGRDNETDGYIFRTSELPNSVGAYSDNTINEVLLAFAYPNPFNSTLNIDFFNPLSSPVTIILYDINGREIMKRDKQRFNTGRHSVTFDGRSLPSGSYFVSLKSDKFVRYQKVELVR